MKTLDSDFILSEARAMVQDVHHPWHQLRDTFPDWNVAFVRLPSGVLAATDRLRRAILLDPRQLQAQLRCSLDHELLHAENDDEGCQHPHRERAIDRESARRLIPLAQLLETTVWAHDVEELADECWVDVATMQCRLDNLSDAERAAVRQAIAVRDFHEEGMSDG